MHCLCTSDCSACQGWVKALCGTCHLVPFMQSVRAWLTSVMYLPAACGLLCSSNFHPSVVFTHCLDVCKFAHWSLFLCLCVWAIHSVSLQSADKDTVPAQLFLFALCLQLQASNLISYLCSFASKSVGRLIYLSFFTPHFTCRLLCISKLKTSLSSCHMLCQRRNNMFWKKKTDGK